MSRLAFLLEAMWRRQFYEIQVKTPAPIATEGGPLGFRSASPHSMPSKPTFAALPADERRQARQRRTKTSRRRPASLARSPACRRLRQVDHRRGDPLRTLALGKVLTRFLDDGRIEIDSNVVERSIRPISASGAKIIFFAGSDGGGEQWAVIASLVETCKMNAVDPQAYLHDVLSKIVARHPMGRIDELLPFAYVAGGREGCGLKQTPLTGRRD